MKRQKMKHNLHLVTKSQIIFQLLQKKKKQKPKIEIILKQGKVTVVQKEIQETKE